MYLVASEIIEFQNAIVKKQIYIESREFNETARLNKHANNPEMSDFTHDFTLSTMIL